MVPTGEEWLQRYLINLSVDEIEQKYQYWHRLASCDNTVFMFVATPSATQTDYAA
jgi:hypothetical protein